MAILLIDFNEYYVTTILYEFLTEENLSEFDESLVVCQILVSKFEQYLVTYIMKANKQEFAKGLLVKSF